MEPSNVASFFRANFSEPKEYIVLRFIRWNPAQCCFYVIISIIHILLIISRSVHPYGFLLSNASFCLSHGSQDPRAHTGFFHTNAQSHSRNAGDPVRCSQNPYVCLVDAYPSQWCYTSYFSVFTQVGSCHQPLARALGLEPRTTVLETLFYQLTTMLPISKIGRIRTCNRASVRTVFPVLPLDDDSQPSSSIGLPVRPAYTEPRLFHR